MYCDVYTHDANLYVSDDYMSSGDSLGGGAIQQSYSPQPSPHHWSQGSLTSGIPPGGGNMHQMQGYVTTLFVYQL